MPYLQVLKMFQIGNEFVPDRLTVTNVSFYSEHITKAIDKQFDLIVKKVFDKVNNEILFVCLWFI